MTLIVRPGFQFDTDASTYIEAVEVADAQALETATRYAINDFVIGCKQDGIWSAIKASCILSGARTLAGALVPLVGTAPTNNNFVSGDYNRKTGLVGDGSTKYLNSNRADNADPQNNRHIAVVSTTALQSGKEVYGSTSGQTSAYYSSPQIYLYDRNVTATSSNSGVSGFYGSTRTAATVATARIPNSSIAFPPSTSITPAAATLLLFCGRDPSSVPRLYSNARLAFYSIGESLDLALLDARVSALITAFGVAIP